MTISQLRHDLLNHLNTIKLNCALLSRRHADAASQQSIREIDASADTISELLKRVTDNASESSLRSNRE